MSLPESIVVQLRPVLDTTHQTADMHKVKPVLVPSPLKLSIIDFELDVCRDPGGLDWGQVGPGDCC
jgi:hypothetical protein